MHTIMRVSTIALVGAALAVSGCQPRRIHQPPIIDNNARIPDVYVDDVAAEAAHRRAELQAERDAIAAQALATCRGEVCAAITRGEVTLGMDETQVLAATRTTLEAWTIRRADGASIMVPRSAQHAPRDAVGQVAMVQVADGAVRTYSYREAQGVRVVSAPEDATTAGRARALAGMMIREGDDYAARGQFELALNRYDRAHVLDPADPQVTYRVATTLDKMLRPREAEIQYRLFLHQLELERIRAAGDVYASMAEAMVYARERLVVLERR
jgi:tetratricopeptide (TPR) repeat protein